MTSGALDALPRDADAVDALVAGPRAAPTPGGRETAAQLAEALASAHHYGFRLRLCKAYRPQTKGKVESDVPYVRERLLRGHGLASYEQANAAWRSWNDDIARQRVHGTHGEVVAVRAERDRAALLALPATPYVVVERTTRTVARDGFFSFEGRRYAVSGVRPGERVELVLGERELEIYSTVDGRRLARHERGRPHRVLPDPTANSVSLAQVLQALPDPEVHTRPLSVYRSAAAKPARRAAACARPTNKRAQGLHKHERTVPHMPPAAEDAA